MDFGLIATSAVSFLVPYLSKLADQFTGEIGEDLSEYAEGKIKVLYETIKNKFKGDDYARQSLERLEKTPENILRQQTLAGVIEETLSQDEPFLKTLEHLLEDVKQAGGGNISQTGSGVAAGDHSVAAGHGGYAAGRDININK
jgi:hypothetical protein